MNPTPPADGNSFGQGIDVLTGGTDVHLALVDLRALQPELSGRQAEDRLHEIGITVNRNAVPFDPRPPMEASGLRIGTPALATRGLQREDFAEVGQIIAATLLAPDFAREVPRAVRARAGDRRALPAVRVAARLAPLPSRTTPTPAMLCTSRWRNPTELDALYAFLVAAAVTALLTPLTMRLARAVGAIDEPRERGLSERPTPLLGGLAIFAGVLVATLIWLPAGYGRSHRTQLWHGVLLAAAADHARGRARRPLRPAAGGQARRPGPGGGDRRALRRGGEGDHAAVRRQPGLPQRRRRRTPARC